jgi:hypothetical protein
MSGPCDDEHKVATESSRHQQRLCAAPIRQLRLPEP